MPIEIVIPYHPSDDELIRAVLDVYRNRARYPEAWAMVEEGLVMSKQMRIQIEHILGPVEWQVKVVPR